VEAGSARLSSLGRAQGLFDRLRFGRVRLLFPAIYLGALAFFVLRDGVPMGRDRLLMWIVLGLLAFSLSNVRGWARSVVLEWLPFALVLWAYDLLRGAADGLLFETHFRPQLEADALLFGGVVPTVWLQEHLWHGSWDLRWYDYAAWGVYMSYFAATYLAAALLWFFARPRFRRYVASVSLLAFMGFATYALFPAAPPWLASLEGELGPTTRSVGLISAHVPVLDFATLFERGSAYANPVAAVPSLHAAYTLLVTIFLWRYAGRLRPLLAAYPVAMAFALVYTAEHYLVDVLLGFAYTGLAVAAVDAAASRLAASPRVAALGRDRRQLLDE
jgi:PAP2 superfamily